MKPDSINRTYRQSCQKCLRPLSCCYCHLIEKIDAKIQFVILIHPLEAQRKIATGRMAHLCLSDSLLIKGKDFTQHETVNQLIQNPNHHCLLLYPGPEAIDLSKVIDFGANPLVFPVNKKPVIFVIDGTWCTAKKTFRLSANLRKLPRVCFTPEMPSQFRIRRQPAPNCYSTIEAIHYILERLAGPKENPLRHRPHDGLMKVFTHMVEQQISFNPNFLPRKRKILL